MRPVLFLLVLAGADRMAAQAPDLGPPPGRLVDIGGRKLHLHCTGSGSPTVVLEAGASAFAIDWTLVQQEVARTNRICSYDRAGSGWSDAATPATRASVSHDLHRLLELAGEQQPYVMVGASLGGIFVRLFQAEYPAEVVGMVLVDPASETRLFTMYRGEGVQIASLTAEQLRETIPPGMMPVPKRPVQTGTPFDRLPPELYALRLKLDARLIASLPDSVSYDARLAYAEGQRARLARLRELSAAEPHPLGDRPLVVLTRGLDSSQGAFESHEQLARLSRNARHTVVAGAGHEIHLFQPKAVIQAIADVTAGRSGARVPPG